jgi:zinc protease
VSTLGHGGAFLAAPGREGGAGLAVDVVERGPAGRSFVEFSRGFERLGSHLSLEAGSELSHAGLTLLSRHAGTGLNLLVDALEEPAFREDDVEVVRALALNDLEARADDLDDVAEDLFFPAVAGDHPYAKLAHGSPGGVAAVTREELREIAREVLRPDHAHLAIVGDLDENVLAPVLARFGALPRPAGARPPIPDLALDGTERTAVATRTDKAQAKVWWGGPGLASSDPDRFAAIVFNHVLGGSAIRSRLGDTIRDQQGLAYSVWSRNYERRQGGFFLVSLGTRPENVRRAVDSIRAEVRRLAEGGPTQAELDDARDYLTGSFPLRFTTYGRLARFWSRSSFHGWPDDYLATYPEKIRALTAADLERAGRRLLAAAGTLAVAGPVGQDLAAVSPDGAR